MGRAPYKHVQEGSGCSFKCFYIVCYCSFLTVKVMSCYKHTWVTMEAPPFEAQVLTACNTLNGSSAGSVGNAAALAMFLYATP